MTPGQVKLIQDSFANLAPIAEKVADLFHQRLFAIAPELRPLFPDDLSRQKKMMMQIMATGVKNIQQLQIIIPAVQELGRRHADYGATEKQYESVAAAMLWAIEQGLGATCTPSVIEAWTAFYCTIADVMQKAAAELQSSKKSPTVA